jgi:hypothetical protein
MTGKIIKNLEENKGGPRQFSLLRDSTTKGTKGHEKGERKN